MHTSRFKSDLQRLYATIGSMFGLLKNKNKRIYMDHASGTACSKSVFTEMKPFFIENSYNPGGIYKEAVHVRQFIESSRSSVAAILKSRPEEITFVDGATEANNIAIIGTIRAWKKNNPDIIPHVVTTTIEHTAVLETCKALEHEGVLVTYLGVNEQGLINLRELKESLRENTVIVSVGYVNGEIGTIQDIRAMMKTIRHYRKTQSSVYPYMHTDAVQAVNYVNEISLPRLGVDLMTINASKIYGPKKIAVLFIKSNIVIDPIIYGGNQEKGMRSGTENVPYIVGMAKSLQETRVLQTYESRRLSILQKDIETRLRELFPKSILNSNAENKIPNIVNITFPNISHEEIVIRLDARGIMASVKSACKAGEDGDSHVIKTVARGDRDTGSIRFSFGRTTTQKDINHMLNQLKEIVTNMNEVYEKYYIK